MTETNHSQSIPVSPNVFPTKNKKMTESPKTKLIIAKAPKAYKLNPKKLRGASTSVLPAFLGAFYYTEDYEYFDVIKPYLIIPEEPKTLEEIKQELDKKFEEIIEQYKRNSYASKLTTERKYEDKFDRISYNFQCAVNNGVFPRYFSLTTSGNASIGNTITHNFVLKPNAIGVGYWEIDPKIQVYRKTKPNRIVRYFSRLLLDFHWKDTL
jgi:hypothetical protein